MKEKAWELIKKRNIDAPFKNEVYSMIEKHFDRVEFVKDHLGLRDFLFLAEEGTEFTSCLFSAIDMDVEKYYNNEQHHESFLRKYNEDPIEVVNEVKKFFEETDRTLFVGIGFIECTMTQNDIKEVIGLLQRGIVKDQFEGLRRVRKFPDWYNQVASFPNEVQFETKTEEKVRKKAEKELMKKQIMAQIDAILDKNEKTKEDEEEFNRLSKEYKKYTQLA